MKLPTSWRRKYDGSSWLTQEGLELTIALAGESPDHGVAPLAYWSSQRRRRLILRQLLRDLLVDREDWIRKANEAHEALARIRVELQDPATLERALANLRARDHSS